MSQDESSLNQGPVRVERWASETPLFVFVVFGSLVVWLLLALSLVGILYAALIGLFLFLVRATFVAYVRGSAVRLGPEQFPALYERVVTLSQRAGLPEVPAAYVMEAGGSLNAFATRFFRTRIIVLFSDLLEACEDDDTARDMIIGHEIGHIHARHLDWWWLIAPGTLIPFLGHAYSRACELTCDRYGAILCGDERGATRGLTLLAAGRKHGPAVNLEAYVAQSEDLDTGWMTIGKWLSGYPPLSSRVAALRPSLTEGVARSIRGPLRATLIMGSIFIIPVIGSVLVFALLLPSLQNSLDALNEPSAFADDVTTPFEGDTDAARAQVEADFETIIDTVRIAVADGAAIPEDTDELDALWEDLLGTTAPRDPFDSLQYGFYEIDGELTLWSSGADSDPGTADDIERTFTVEQTAPST